MNKMIAVIDLSSDDETPTPKSIPKGMSDASTNTTTQEQRNQQQQQRQGQHCQTSQPKLDISNNTNNKSLSRIDSDFIDHVVMVWLHRVRKGYRNIEMPEYILKAKAKEAASLMNVDSKFTENSWLKAFQEKMKKMQDQKQTIETGNSTVFRIEAIIYAERYNFYTNYERNDLIALKKKEEERLKRLKEIEDKQQKQLSNMLEEQKKHLEKVKETQRQQMEDIKYAQKEREVNLRKEHEMRTKSSQTPPASATKLRFGVLRNQEETNKFEVSGAVTKKALTGSEQHVTLCEVIEVDDVLDQPIQSYEEALDCLALVENYLLSTRNLNAVMFVNQIETFIKQQLESKSVG